MSEWVADTFDRVLTGRDGRRLVGRAVGDGPVTPKNQKHVPRFLLVGSVEQKSDAV